MKKNIYYKQKQYIEKVDRNGKHLGYIDKWEAHEKGILHRAFTPILIYNNYYLIQHRKHPAFDAVYDLTFSSHQLFVNDKLQSSLEGVKEALKREWNINQKDMESKPKYLGSLYYKAKDPHSIYTEHEIDEIFIIKLKFLPSPNLDFAYGYSLATKEELKNIKGKIYQNLAPWSKKIVDQKMI